MTIFVGMDCHLINTYASAHTSELPSYMDNLERHTHLHHLGAQMLSGQLQGQFLSLITRMLQPKTVVEVGTYTGYATLCFAANTSMTATVHTIELDPELAPTIHTYLEENGWQDRVQVHFGEAVTIMPTIPGPWNLVFIDADKLNYDRYYEIALTKCPPGAVILADNVLWKGKVLHNTEDQDKRTRALDAFNKKVTQDDRVDNVLLPLRDGIMMIMVK